MAHLLILYGQREPTNIIIEDFFSAISCNHNFEMKALKVDNVTTADILWSDIVMGIRTMNILEADIMAWAKKNGRLVIEAIDDDLFAIKDFHIRRRLQEKALLQALQNVNIVLSFSEDLLEKMRPYTKPGTAFHALHNAVGEDEIFYRKTACTHVINIAYYASDGTRGNYNQIIKPILDKLGTITDKQIRWHFFTTHPDMTNTPYAEYVTYYPNMPLEDFRSTLKRTEIDIGIAPLLDNEFNSGKYVNKFFEYTRAGIPAIYSNVKPYAGFIEDGINGILADNTEGAWLNAFERMFDKKTREQILENSQSELRTQYSVEAICKKALEDIPELLNEHKDWDKSPRLYFFKVKGKIYKLMDKPQRAIGRLRVEGLRSTFGWLMGHYVLKTKQ